MYLNKYGIGNGTYVKLDELNDLMKAERRKCMKEAKLAHKAGDSDTKMRFVYEHGAILDLYRKINMSENGEMHLIFTRDKDGDWEFLVDVVRWDDLPEYMRKAAAKAKAEWVVIGTSEIEEATLYKSFEEAEAELRRVVENTGSEAWHITKKWMFDTKDNRESLLALFYDGGEEKPKKPKAKKPYIPPRYTVWYRDDGETTQHCMGFVRYEMGIPVYTNRPCKASWFTYREAAEKVAADCGEGFEVVDMWEQMTKEQRLLRAILLDDHGPNDEDPCEWHGDGTRAEDEDWEDE